MLIDHYHGLSQKDHLQTHKTTHSFLGFDLALEQAHINQERTGYRQEFINNAEFYAKETYGKPSSVNYVHEVVQADNGEMRLKMENRDVLAKDSYVQGMYNPNHPDWLRKRAIKDYEWITALEEHLQQAKVGDIFIDASPTAFDISLEERKKYMFGNHSFIRLHQFVEENGKKMLRSVAVLHYLDEESQKNLYNWLTEQSLQADELLGNVTRLQKNLGISDVTDVEQVRKLVATVNNLYIHTPPEKRLPQDTQIDDTVLNSHLKTLRPWLESIFFMMRTNADRGDIVRSFHGWENAFRSRISGNYTAEEDLELIKMQSYMHEEIASMSQSSVSSSILYEQMFAVMRNYMDQEYKPPANSCGNGAGYSDGAYNIFNPLPSWLNGTMSYANMTQNYFSPSNLGYAFLKTENRHEDYHCPKCNTKIKGEIKGSDPSTWRTHCTNSKCDYEFRCATES